ncbi:DUF2017 domain-containing protein [Angustibacter peucedani]
MARGFKRARHGVRAKLDDHERALLAHLLVEVHEMLDDGPDVETDPLAVMVGIGTAVDPPSDPAVARLLPDAHRDDPDASAEFRRYTEAGLRARKREGLEVARRSLGRDGTLHLDDDEARAWVVALTDVRLVLASRLGLETDDDHERLLAVAEAEAAELAEAEEGEPSSVGGVAFMLEIYDFLTWLQETLVEALMAPLPTD